MRIISQPPLINLDPSAKSFRSFNPSATTQISFRTLSAFISFIGSSPIWSAFHLLLSFFRSFDQKICFSNKKNIYIYTWSNNKNGHALHSTQQDKHQFIYFLKKIYINTIWPRMYEQKNSYRASTNLCRNKIIYHIFLCQWWCHWFAYLDDFNVKKTRNGENLILLVSFYTRMMISVKILLHQFWWLFTIVMK